MARRIRISRPAPLRIIGGYWRGDCPPWIALFVVLIGGRLVLGQLWRSLPLPMSTPLFALLIAADVALALWQMVGAWRSLSQGVDARAQGHVLLAGQVTVVVVAVVIVNSGLDQAARQAQTPVRYVAPEPLQVRDGVAYLTGEIDYDLMARFDATPAASFSTLELDSAGGRIFAARALAKRVSARGLTTLVTKRCYSACTLIFMAGAHHDLGPKGELGFHGYHLEPYQPLIDVAAQEAIDRAFLRDHGVSESFVKRAFATPHKDIWLPDRQVLAAAGVLRD